MIVIRGNYGFSPFTETNGCLRQMNIKPKYCPLGSIISKPTQTQLPW